MSGYLCFGDQICLYCEDTQGFMYSEQSSSTMDGLFVYTAQDRAQPKGIPNPHAITFQVYSMNRYKLAKKYRVMVKKHGLNPEDEDLNKQVQAAKKTAMVEEDDNTAEQGRLLGKRLSYGQTIQLLHVFTNKFIHISTDNTSVIDKSKMMVSLQTVSAKNAQFKIQPRYKIKVEGELIEQHDQIVLESVKSPGNFLGASASYQIDSFTRGSELNAGVDKAGFTILIHYRQSVEKEGLLKGGDVTRLFHKDIEAYLVAEGGFQLPPVDDVHLRIREANPMDPRTLYQPKSGITYWQIELASSIHIGSVIRWEDSVRFRHMTTRRYLAVSENNEIQLVDDGLSPTTVFKIHSLSLRPELNEIRIDSNVRIENVVTACWLHAPVDAHYEKKRAVDPGGGDGQAGDGSGISGLVWDGAELMQVAASSSQQYQDAFTIQKVPEKQWRNFNYVAGIVPFMEDLIVKRQDPNYLLTTRQTVSIVTTLKDLQLFVEAEGERVKDRQKLLRNLCVVDVMVRLLKTPVSSKSKDRALLDQVFRNFYQCLHTYTKGRSKKNALYAAHYIPFFMQQLPAKGDVGLECCKMMIDLVRDNRRIVDRITPTNLCSIINLFKARQHYYYLDLLGVLSVCDNIAMAENQTLIAEELLEKQKDCMYHIELGQDVAMAKDIIYVSMDGRKSWIALHNMSYKSNPIYDEGQFLFLTHQLELYKKLCYGRNQKAVNVITRNREYFTWEVAYLGLMSDLLPFTMRAKFCNLLIGLFIEVGDNFSIISVTSNNFVYDEIDIKNYGQSAADAVPHDFDAHFPSMRAWLGVFFEENCSVISSQPGRNVLLKEVLNMVTALIKYGFLGSKEEMDNIMKPVFNLIDGTKDIPFSPGKGTGDLRKKTFLEMNKKRIVQAEFTKDQLTMVKKWRKNNRFEKNSETDAIIQVKLQGLEMIEILLIKEFNRRVRYFVSTFKKIEMKESKTKKHRKILGKLLYEDFDTAKLWTDQAIKKKIDKMLTHMYSMTELIHPSLPGILFDLTKYPSDDLNTKALSILNKFYGSKLLLFHTAQRSHALLATESVRVHRGALQNMVVLTRLTKSKLSADMAREVARILISFSELCYIPHKPLEPHPIGQNILVNNGILNILLPTVTQEVDKNLKDQFAISEQVIGAALEVLRFLASKNAYVQSYLMDELEALLSVQCCGELQALALLEIFRDHTVHCLRLQPSQIQRIVRLAGIYRERAPSFLLLLKVIMKLESNGTLLKRNQHLVTKYVMESYKSAAYVMNISALHRLQMLIGKEGPDHQRYLITFIELLATCAEGENRYIESLCQTLVTVSELINILNNRNVPMMSKVGFVRYFVWAYMRTARNVIESGVDDLAHNPQLWKHFRIITSLLSRVNVLRAKAVANLTPKNPHAEKKSVFYELMAKTKQTATQSLTLVTTNLNFDLEGLVTYMLRGGFLLVQTFFSRFYEQDEENYPEEVEALRKLASAAIKFVDSAGEYTTSSAELTIMVECIETLAQSLNVSKVILEKISEETNFKKTVLRIKDKVKGRWEITPASATYSMATTYSWEQNSKAQKPGHQYNMVELDMNKQLHNFGRNLVTYLENRNTLNAQLNIRGQLGTTPYIPDDLEVKIPLGEEFQVHVKNFSLNGPDGNQRIHSIIDHLEIAAKNVKNSSFIPEETLDIRCVQILRSLLYNKFICLPDNWSLHLQKYKRVLKEIRAIQDLYLDYKIMHKILPLLDRRVPVAMEVLSLIDLMLFHSNTRMQEILIKYFTSTAEEIFFIFVRQRLQVAVTALKEKRSIKAQADARKRELKKKKDPDCAAKEESKQKKVKISKRAQRKKSLKPFFRRLTTNRLLVYEDQKEEDEHTERPHWLKEIDLGLLNAEQEEEEEEEEEESINVGNYQDGSDVVLVFRILARLCDGQYGPLQDYLRTQPDNLRKVNLVAEMTNFFGSMYTHIDGSNIDLATQVISAIMEICMGNQENRAVVLNNKIIDYSNFLLRVSHFEDCEVGQVIDLKMEVVILLLALIEENGPGCSQIARMVRDTLDIGALRRHLQLAHRIVVLSEGKADLEKLICGSPTVKVEKKKKITKEVKEQINILGFSFYFILARFFDVDSKLEKTCFTDRAERAAYRHYRSQCRSVEVIKDGHIQKVHFRVVNPDLVREEVKEELKWNINRTSPSNKLRDLLQWTKDILKDVDYQRKIQKNMLIKELTKRWPIWNYASILLSLAIQLMMLATWESAHRIDQIPANATSLPAEITNPVPLIQWSTFNLMLYILGGLHNVSSVMLFVTYMMLKHPRMPNFGSFLDCFKNCFKKCKKQEEDEEDDPTASSNGQKKPEKDDDDDDQQPSRLQPSLLSGMTIYILLLMALSFAGTFFYGYFFAFHLINIVSNNELLKGVVKAVTQNGQSLLWVGIMGVIVIYLYALIAFAFMRASFDEDNEMYCNTLLQCFITVLRYGVIGDITDMIKLNPLGNSFISFTFITIYHLSFFILFTTIGLNIIFGIIVDTFSELRDLKWTAEKDMRDTCFICSRDSYDFEHQGQGFNHHVHNEHNIWAYVFYFLHLKETPENDCGAIDLYVLKMVQKDGLDFFPLNRALCLAAEAEDETDTKLDDVAATLDAMTKRQRREEELKRREAERRRQAAWQDQFRRAHDGRHLDSPSGSHPDNMDSMSYAGESVA